MANTKKKQAKAAEPPQADAKQAEQAKPPEVDTGPTEAEAKLAIEALQVANDAAQEALDGVYASTTPIEAGKCVIAARDAVEIIKGLLEVHPTAGALTVAIGKGLVAASECAEQAEEAAVNLYSDSPAAPVGHPANRSAAAKLSDEEPDDALVEVDVLQAIGIGGIAIRPTVDQAGRGKAGWRPRITPAVAVIPKTDAEALGEKYVTIRRPAAAGTKIGLLEKPEG